MCDQITQLQDQINQIAEHMCNTIGMLQQAAPSSILPGRTQLNSAPLKSENSDFDPKDLPPLFATLITRAVKDLDLLIDLLPTRTENADETVSKIEKLQKENVEAAKLFAEARKINENLLFMVRNALKEFADCEMEIDRLNLPVIPDSA